MYNKVKEEIQERKEQVIADEIKPTVYIFNTTIQEASLKSHKLRIPLVLNIYSEMDLAEIASIMGIPEGTVKSRLFTARKQMREFLDDLEK